MIRTGKILLIASAMGIAVLALAAMLLGRDGSTQPPAASVAPAAAGPGSAVGAQDEEPGPVAVAPGEPAPSAAPDPETVPEPDVATSPAQDWDQVAADAAAVGMTSMDEPPSSDTAPGDAGQVATP